MDFRVPTKILSYGSYIIIQYSAIRETAKLTVPQKFSPPKILGYQYGNLKYIATYACLCMYISIAASAIREIKHEACGGGANKARGAAECFISNEATCRVLYFAYSTSKAML